MRTKSLVAIATSLALVFGVSTANAATVKCSSSTVKKTISCSVVKVTPKPVAKAPVVVSTPTSTVTPVASKYPAGLDPSVGKMFEKALAEVNSASAPGKVPDINIFIENGYPLSHEKIVVDGIKEMLSRFGAWNTSQKSYYLIFAITKEFADKKFSDLSSELNYDQPLSVFHGPYWDEMWNPNRVHIPWTTNTTVNGHSVQLFQNYVGYEASDLDKPGPIHEAWHPLLDMYVSPSRVASPCWFNEGVANFIGQALATGSSNVNDYFKIALKMGPVSQKEILSTKQIEGNSPNRDTNWATETCNSLGGYSEGTTVAATLIATYGWDKMLQFAKLPSMQYNWYTHFQEVYGITPEEFYKTSDSMLQLYRKYVTGTW